MIFDLSDSYLDESGLVAEAVVAVLAHAVEVGLVLPVVAVGELAVLIEPEDVQVERQRQPNQTRHGKYSKGETGLKLGGWW